MMMKKKVCHITSAHNRYDQRILHKECISLYEAGYNVTLLVNDEKMDERYKGVEIRSTGKNYKNKRVKRMVLGVHALYKMAKAEKADIYHFHDPELLCLAKKLKRKGCYVIFDSHENYYEQILQKNYIPVFFRKMVAKGYRKYESSVLNIIDGVIFPVCMEGIDIEKRAKRVAYVNNVPKLDELPSVKTEPKGRKICYAGGLTYNRGVKHLAEAAKRADVQLYLAGTFESDELKKCVTDDERHVHYEGFLSRTELYELYQKCAIGMSTLLNVGQYSKMQNLPTKVYEYMAMGMPVILSDIPYNRSVIEEYQFGVVVDPQNVTEIANSITCLMDNPSAMKTMGEKGRELIYGKWNWSIEEKNLLCLYKELGDEYKKM